MRKRDSVTREAAESMAIQALGYLAGEPARLARFLAFTGVGPAQIREAATTPGFLAGVLDHVASDDTLLTAFAAEAALDPAQVGEARRVLAGGNWEREVP